MPEYRITPDREPQRGWKFFSLFGVPVYVEPWFLLTVAIIFTLFAGPEGQVNYQEAGLVSFIIFFSVLVHEFGHALSARLCGCDGIRVVLVAFGGYTTHSPTSHGRSLFIIAAGPAFGLILGLVAWLLLRADGIHTVGPAGAMTFVLSTLFLINIFWTIFNLLPIHPLDGGQALFHGLSLLVDPNKAMLFVARLSMLLCIIVAIVGYRMGYILIPIFCISYFMNNWQISRILGGSS